MHFQLELLLAGKVHAGVVEQLPEEDRQVLQGRAVCQRQLDGIEQCQQVPVVLVHQVVAGGHLFAPDHGHD